MLVRMPNKFNKLLWVKTGVSRVRVERTTLAATHAKCTRNSLAGVLLTRLPPSDTGSYLIANVADAPGGDKVRGEVTAVLYEEHVRQMRKDGNWCVTNACSCAQGSA